MTDRALRYRANATPPHGEKRCCLCGGKQNVEVGHVNGREEDSEPKNLFWNCRSCNVLSANTMRKAGLGRPTNQYNPAAEGAVSLGQWMNAISSMKGDGGTMAVKDAVAMIRATSPAARSRFALDIWQRRRMHSNPHNRQSVANPAASGKQYRLAQAVLSGVARAARMTKKVAREIVDKTPAKLRSEFEKKQNLFGFGKAKTTFSSRLSKEAYNAGYKGSQGHRGDEFFDKWFARRSKSEKLGKNVESDLRREYWRGVHDEERDATQNKDKLQAKKREVEERKADSRQPKGHGSRSSAGGNTSYKGKTIKQVDGKFEVLGTDWNSLRDAKEFVDLHVATGGKVRMKNPNWSLRQGKSQAFVYETRTGTHAADIVSPGSAIESQSFSGPHSFRSATSWARLRLHEVSNPKGSGRVKIFKRGTAKRNPIDKAEKMYEEFHGLPSTEVREYKEQEHRHSVVWGIGPMISMKVVNVQGNKTVEIFAPDPADAKLGDVVMLTASEDGRQFIPVGGDQKINLKNLDSFGVTEADVRDHMLIGTIVQITYRTRKTFEKDGKEEVDFYHDLGKEGSKGVCPVLIYKPRNPSMEIAGGRYQIAKPERSLGGVSPGIVG